MTERPRPCRPAPAWYELTDVSVRLEVFFTMPEHLVEARFVLLNRRIPRRVGELPLEQTPQRSLRAGAAILGCEPVVDVSPFWFLDDEP